MKYIAERCRVQSNPIFSSFLLLFYYASFYWLCKCWQSRIKKHGGCDLKRMSLCDKTSSTPPPFLEVPIPRQEDEPIGFRNCSDSVVFFVFSFYLAVRYPAIKSIDFKFLLFYILRCYIDFLYVVNHVSRSIKIKR